MLAVFPHPSPVELPVPSDVLIVAAMPGTPGTVLGIDAYPPFICDVVVVPSFEVLSAAIKVVLAGTPDARISKADYLRDLLRAQTRGTDSVPRPTALRLP